MQGLFRNPLADPAIIGVSSAVPTAPLRATAVRADDRHASVDEFVAQMQVLLERAADRLRPGLDLRAAALGLFALVDGLMHHWTLGPDRFDLLAVGDACVGAYLGGVKAAAPAAPAAPAEPRKAARAAARSSRHHPDSASPTGGPGRWPAWKTPPPTRR